MDEIIRKLAGVGFPAVLLLITMSATGLSGAAAVTTALALLGPGGMVSGVILLGIVGLASEALMKYKLQELITGIYHRRVLNGEPIGKIRKEIELLPISKEFKLLLKDRF
jgi:hypothetical protein